MPARKPQHPRPAKRRRRRRRGPIIRFHLSRLILIWVFCFVIAFVLYMLSRNLHPEKDVFRDHSEQSSSSLAETTDTSTSEPTESSGTPAAESSIADESSAAEESSSPAAPVTNKVNPVPEGAVKSAEYLKTCAFLGEANIYRMKTAGLLGEMNTYASETLNLSNYGKDYILLNGTTIHIQSALYAAKCPIYMMFGTESLSKQPADETAEQFKVLLNLLKASAPQATFFVMSIPPVTAAVEKTISNATIDEYNSLLLQAANEADVYFVDTNTALKNNKGKLDPANASEDGIHLNAQGAEFLLNYVLSHVPS